VDFTNPPAQIVVHLPWFIDLASATADGENVRPANGALVVPAATRTVELRWTITPNTPQLSYSNAVAAYEAEYTRRYQALMHGATAK
jgi:hypothetical protein